MPQIALSVFIRKYWKYLALTACLIALYFAYQNWKSGIIKDHGVKQDVEYNREIIDTLEKHNEVYNRNTSDAYVDDRLSRGTF